MALGLTAAYFAAEQGAQVSVLERMSEAGRKILISGGTRCNVLPMSVDIQRDYVSEASASALRRVFASWSLEDCRLWLESSNQISIPLATEPDTAKFFPASNSAKQVRNQLLAACLRRGVDVRYNASVEDLSRRDTSGWDCHLEDGAVHAADTLVLASGGQSFPSLGTTGTGYRLVQQHGHTLMQPYPALTPLKGPHPGGAQLAGTSLYTAELKCLPTGKAKRRAYQAERSAMLFTHRGYSGPSILDLSHHAVRALEQGSSLPVLQANWTGEERTVWDAQLASAGGSLVPVVLRRHGLTQRLAAALCEELGLQERRAAELRKGERAALLDALVAYPLQYNGHEGYPKAEVTGGGVPLAQISCATMESTRMPGVYLCGELVDVFGRIGGFNFYWAWLSGRLAGIHAAQPHS
ncbi:hypothetical protein WJX72_003465 [[Myrmecia] bisecta]|uniref:Aminoacetone oxidase family FAD-binding enzyme n=1 Tax=[Myrmecia] bisecta TaxID=41462 RepID=A0AAW1Q483_9CHLO